MTFNIAISMRNNDKFQSHVTGDSLEQIEKYLLDKPVIKLTWEKAWAIINMADISTLLVSEVEDKAVVE